MFVWQLHSIRCLLSMSILFCATYCTLSNIFVVLFSYQVNYITQKRICPACGLQILLCRVGAFFHAPYMRQVMDIAFAEGNRLHVPVILETDAQSKCDKYVHLGMQLAGKRSLGAYGALYDLVKEPE